MFPFIRKKKTPTPTIKVILMNTGKATAVKSPTVWIKI